MKVNSIIPNWFKPINIPNYDLYIKGIWTTSNDNINDKKGNDTMFNNELLDLYYSYKMKEIENKYDKIIDDIYNANEVVKEYNDDVNAFEATLSEIANKYNTEENKILVKNSNWVYSYKLNIDCKQIAGEQIFKDREQEIEDLVKMIKEVRSLLYLHKDVEYRLNVLKNYGIIDEKTGRLNI